MNVSLPLHKNLDLQLLPGEADRYLACAKVWSMMLGKKIGWKSGDLRGGFKHFFIFIPYLRKWSNLTSILLGLTTT